MVRQTINFEEYYLQKITTKNLNLFIPYRVFALQSKIFLLTLLFGWIDLRDDTRVGNIFVDEGQKLTKQNLSGRK